MVLHLANSVFALIWIAWLVSWALTIAFGRRVFHPMVAPKAAKPLAEEIFVPARAVTPRDKRPDLPDRALKMKTALLLGNPKGDPLVNKPDGINCGGLKLKVGATWFK
jgi:hypothetical protein